MNERGLKMFGQRKAWIALTASLACLAIYIAACVLSPPSWSPDSSRLALLVTPPDNGPAIFKLFVYDRTTDERVLLDTVRSNGVLSAPAWSPDGKWIAYYRVEPTVPDEAEESVEEPGSGSGSPDRPAANEPPASRSRPRGISLDECLPKDNRVLPPIFGLVDTDDLHDSEWFEVKLMIIRPDGTDRKTLHTLKWVGDDDDDRVSVMLLSPAWGKDSQRLFYLCALEKFSYVGSVDVSTGEACAHTMGGIPVVSPDGRWVASGLEGDIVVVAGIDGHICRYLKLEGDVHSRAMQDLLFWSPDSQKVCAVTDGAVLVIDVASGRTEPYVDPDGDDFAYFTPSTTDNRIYYLSKGDSDNPSREGFRIKYVDLTDRKTGTLFTLTEVPDIDDGDKTRFDEARFSIAPNGQVVLLRTILKDPFLDDCQVMILWDGKTRKIVKTDRWLLEPVCTDADLTFDERLLGTWKSKGEQLSINRGPQDKTYRISLAEADEQRTVAANLIKLKDKVFLGMFFDESTIVRKDRSTSHLCPDKMAIVHQIEPTLLLQPIEYSDLPAVLQADKDAVLVQPELDICPFTLRHILP